ncbi:MAG: DUF1826 domain-containing protein [Pseudomonadota bacterium]
MTHACDVADAAAVGVRVTQTPKGLSVIHNSGCAAAIWDRAPRPSFQHWLDNIDPKHLPSTRVTLAPDQVSDALSRSALMCGTPNCPECGMLVDDVSALAMVFADVMDTPFIRLRLDVVTSNACRKFHVDALTVRLICTYRGTGTQYGVSRNDKDPEHVFTVPACAPIILRGSKWPESPSIGLRHRSPPIEGTGETRLLLVIDPVRDINRRTDQILTKIQ